MTLTYTAPTHKFPCLHPASNHISLPLSVSPPCILHYRLFSEKRNSFSISLSLSHTHTHNFSWESFHWLLGGQAPVALDPLPLLNKLQKELMPATSLRSSLVSSAFPFPWALFSSHKVHDLLDCLVNVVRVIIWSLSWDFLRTCFSWLSIHCLSVLFWFLFRLFLFLGFCSSFCAGFHGLLACSDSAMLLKKVTTTSSETPWKQSKQKHLPFFFCLHFLPLFSNYPNRNSAILEFFPDSKRHWKWKLIL